MTTLTIDTPKPRGEWRAWAHGAAGMLIFSASLPATRLAVAGLDPTFITAGRALVAGLLGAALLLLTQAKLPRGRDWRDLALAAFGVVLGFPLFSALALRFVPANHAMPFIGLLPLSTRLLAAKRLCRASGWADASLTGSELQMVTGYEIHHGETVGLDAGASEGVGHADGDAAPSAMRVVMRDLQERPLGWGRCDAQGCARVWGSYLHGLFDEDAFRHAFLHRLRQEADLPPAPQTTYSLGPELDRLADAVEASLDMPAILARLGIQKQ